jgi:hypothetical protein
VVTRRRGVGIGLRSQPDADGLQYLDDGGESLLEILADPKHPERRSMHQWLRGHLKNYHPYRPDHFDPAEVVFADPHDRFLMMVE